jgi:hypothetical protein
MKRTLILIAIVMSNMNTGTLYSMEGYEAMSGAGIAGDAPGMPGLGDEHVEQELEGDEAHLATLEQRVAALEQKQKHAVSHAEFTRLADGLVERIQQFERKKPRGNAGKLDSLDDDLAAISTEGLVEPDPEDDDTSSPVSTSNTDPSLPTDLPQASSFNHPTIAGAIALGFHIIGGKDRVKQACVPFNEPTKKAVAQLVEGAVLANVFNATWPKISHGESRNSVAYTATFVAVHIAAKLLKPYVLQKLGMADPDSSDDSSDSSDTSNDLDDDLDISGTDPEIKGLIKNLKNNIAWGQLLAEAAVAYALAPLLMGR